MQLLCCTNLPLAANLHDSSTLLLGEYKQKQEHQVAIISKQETVRAELIKIYDNIL
jgi:hypothetical protein